MRFACIIAFILLLATLTFAALPQTISYQGYLKSADGTPVNTAVNITFSLYSSNPARNNPVWRDTRSVTPANGIYSVILGEGKPISAPFDAPYWLGVQVESDPEMAPLQPLAASPYAFRAAAVDSVESGALADNSVTSAKISGPIAAGKLDLSGVVAKSGDTMTGTLNLPANGLTVGTNQLAVTGGKVGIGTATPNEQLEITGNLRLPPTTATTGIINTGANTLIHTYGTYNFFAGQCRESHNHRLLEHRQRG